MTEEQRYAQKMQIEKDRNVCLKGILEELKKIASLIERQNDRQEGHTCKVPVDSFKEKG